MHMFWVHSALSHFLIEVFRSETLKKEYARSREVLFGPLVVFSVSSPARVGEAL